MSSLADHLWKQYGGNVPSDPQTVARDAIQRYGSGRAAARELGIDEKTIRRWKNGETRESPHVERYAQEARRSYADRKSGPVQVAFRFAKRNRDLRFQEGAGEKGLRSGTEDRIAEAYVAGDREGMAQAFIDGLPGNWYGREIRKAYLAEVEEGAPGEAGEDSGSVGAFPAA